jgi:hypothetical protein
LYSFSTSTHALLLPPLLLVVALLLLRLPLLL